MKLTKYLWAFAFVACQIGNARADSVVYQSQNSYPDQSSFLSAIVPGTLVNRTFDSYGDIAGPVAAQGWGPNPSAFTDSGVTFASTFPFSADCRSGCTTNHGGWGTGPDFGSSVYIVAHSQYVPQQGMSSILANIYLPAGTTAFGIDLGWEQHNTWPIPNDPIAVTAYLASGASVTSSWIFNAYNGPLWETAPWAFYGITVSADDPISWISITDPSFHGGTYLAFDNVSTAVAAIPEPESYAMLLAGLGLLGFAARRRKQKDAVAV